MIASVPKDSREAASQAWRGARGRRMTLAPSHAPSGRGPSCLPVALRPGYAGRPFSAESVGFSVLSRTGRYAYLCIPVADIGYPIPEIKRDIYRP